MLQTCPHFNLKPSQRWIESTVSLLRSRDSLKKLIEQRSKASSWNLTSPRLLELRGLRINLFKNTQQDLLYPMDKARKLANFSGGVNYIRHLHSNDSLFAAVDNLELEYLLNINVDFFYLLYSTCKKNSAARET